MNFLRPNNYVPISGVFQERFNTSNHHHHHQHHPSHAHKPTTHSPAVSSKKKPSSVDIPPAHTPCKHEIDKLDHTTHHAMLCYAMPCHVRIFVRVSGESRRVAPTTKLATSSCRSSCFFDIGVTNRWVCSCWHGLCFEGTGWKWRVKVKVEMKMEMGTDTDADVDDVIIFHLK